MRASRLIGSLFVIATTGQCAAAELVSVNPVVVDFGQVKVGDEPGVAITVRNHADFSMSLAGGGVSGAFAATNGCGASIPANTACQITYSFMPQSRTDFSGSTSLSFSGNDYSQSVAIDLSGTGVESLADVYPVGIEFGELPVGASMSVPITVFNSHVSTIASFAGGGTVSPFSAAQSCAGGVSPGDTCSFTYTFAPASPGDFAEDTGFSFSADGISQSVDVSLTGTGTNNAKIAKAAPISIDYGIIKHGLTTAVPVVIENISAGTLESFAGGGVSAPFSASQTCSGGVPSGDACEFTYSFTPNSEQTVTETTGISFSSTSGGSQSISIELMGRSTGTLARVSPVAIDFGNVLPGESATVPVTIFNDSASTLQSFAGGGVSSDSFSAAQSCSGGVSVGASCSFDYTFEPSGAGQFDASTGISFSNDTGLTESVSISLSGRVDDSLFADSFEPITQ